MATSSAHYIFDILRIIGTENRPLGASDIRRRLNLTLTTTHRGLNTLERAGYIARYQSSTKYVLGAASHALLHSFFYRFPIRSVALPYMQRLTVISGNTTSLFVMIGWYAVRIATVRGTNEVIHTGPVGETSKLDATAAGRAMLAMLPEDRRLAFADWRFRKAGARPSTATMDLLAKIRQRGMAVDVRDHQGTLAYPVIDSAGMPAGALAIEGQSGLAGDEAQINSYAQIVEQLSHAVRTGTVKALTPYGHLDPDTIDLATTGA